MGHKHSVYDSDTHFSINPITRVIRNDASRKTVLIQGDHNSERFTFELPRRIEDHDMSKCDAVEVHYLNIASDKKDQKSGVYTVEDLQVSPDDDQVVVCSWLISQNATQLVGSLNFLLRFRCVENDLTTYVWNTAVHDGIRVSDGINGGETLEADYLDIIEQWKASVIREITNDVNDKVSAWAETESGKIRGLVLEETTKTNAALAVERARIDNIVQLPDGSTTGDAELIDARIDTGGLVHACVGDAVRSQLSAKQDLFADYRAVELVIVADTLYNVNTHSTMAFTYGQYVDYQLSGERILKISGYSHSSSDSFPAATFFDVDNNVIAKVGANAPKTAFEDWLVLVPNGAVRMVLNGKKFEGDVGVKMCIPKDLNALDISAGNIMPEQFNGCVNVQNRIVTVPLATDNTELLEGMLYNKEGTLESNDGSYNTIIYPITGVWCHVDLSNYPVGTHGGAFLDAEKNWISSFSTTTANEEYKVLKPVPANARYIAISKQASTTYKEIYVHSMAYQFDGLTVPKGNIISDGTVDSDLKGKKVVWLGTSVSFGANAETSYPHEAAQKLGFNLVNCSVPGLAIHTNTDGTMKQYGSLVLSKAEYAEQGWTIPNAPIPYIPGGSANNYYRTYENVFCGDNADADLYVFDVVPNNSNFSTSDWNAFDFTNWCYKDGSAFEDHRTTFLGALLFLMDKMYSVNEDARMIFVLGSGFAYWDGKKALQTVEDKWNIPCIDLWGKINTSPKSLIKLRSLDGADPHPSTLAHEIMGRMLVHDLPGVF